MLFLALSCLQGRGQLEAAIELLAYQPDGLQLTPGNHSDWTTFTRTRQDDPFTWLIVDAKGIAFRYNRHQGHSFAAKITRVYSPDNTLLWKEGSIHAHANWRELGALGYTMETMYPNKDYDYGLMTSSEYLEALELGTPVALDLSHADICIQKGLLERDVVLKLLEQGNIQELHVSYNNGRHDTHQPFPETYHWQEQVDRWANRNPDRPVVLECYFHKLDNDERRRQIALFDRCRS